MRKTSTADPHAITAIAQFGNGFSSFSVTAIGGSVDVGWVGDVAGTTTYKNKLNILY